jgi:hypothetical protein
LKPAEAKFIKLDLKINNQKIGYIMVQVWWSSRISLYWL